MGNYRDDRYGGGGERWRGRGWDRDQDYRGGDRERSYGGGENRSRGRDDDNRGFFEKAGDEIRAWFGDDDDHRGRDYDYDRGRGGYGTRGMTGGRSFGGGWGNQSGEAWNRDRPGVREDRPDRGEREGWFSDSHGGERGERYGGGQSGYGADTGVPEAESFGGTGFGGAARGRRFDRIDAGSTGTHGAHPMASHEGDMYGSGAFQSRARERALTDAARGSQGGQGQHDPHYAEWRQRQLQELDRDYDEWRREHQSRFDEEFAGWRTKRQGQRQMLGTVREHMKVVGSDGSHVGTVDKVRGDRIILTRSDENAGGIHHSIPCSWVETVEDEVKLNRTADQATTEWRNEDRNRALFEREDSGSDGPHMLNRSFAGTYDRDEERDDDR